MPAAKTVLYLRPVKSDRRTQGFGDNDVCAKTTAGGFPVRPFVLINKPASGACPPGYRDFYRLIGMNGHNGEDFGAYNREPTYHSGLFNGWALKPNDTDGGVAVVSDNPIVPCRAGCPAGTMHYVHLRYAHGTMAVAAGSHVKPGDLVQYAGNIGSGTGVHVHFSPKYCEKNGTVIHRDNGFSGAFDPGDDLENVFVLDYLRDHIAGTPTAATSTPPSPFAQLPTEIPKGASLDYLQRMSALLYALSVAIKRLQELGGGLMHMR